MRRSILLVLFAALMLTATVGAAASVAGAVGVEAQAARARRRRVSRCGRSRRQAARCKKTRRRVGKLANGFYEDAARRVKLSVTGSKVRIVMLSPMKCPLGGALIQGDGTITRSGAITTASGVISSSAIRVDWTIVVRQPALSYSLKTSFAVTLPDTSPCTGKDLFGGVLTKR